MQGQEHGPLPVRTVDEIALVLVVERKWLQACKTSGSLSPTQDPGSFRVLGKQSCRFSTVIKC